MREVISKHDFNHQKIPFVSLKGAKKTTLKLLKHSKYHYNGSEASLEIEDKFN